MTFTDTLKQNPILTLLILVGVGLVGFLIFGLFTGAAVTVSGILLAVVVLFGLGILLFLIQGAGEKQVNMENFILIILGAAGVFGLVLLLTKFNPGTFAIYDQPLAEIQSFVGGVTNLWIVFGILLLIFLFATKKGAIARKKLGF